MSATFDVGGVLLDRPFQIRRVSHIGLNCTDLPAMLRCYRDHLGLRTTDVSQGFADKVDPDRERLTAPRHREMHFFRYGADHHQFVLMHRDLWALADPEHAEVTINQISWQVGNLAEVAQGAEWLGGKHQRVLRSGRDMPGSNWHTYVLDPDGYTDELTFGMEQVGWDGLSKPRESWPASRHASLPPLPFVAEDAEVGALAADGVDITGGYRPAVEPGRYDVDGVTLARPFKVISHGPFSLVVTDLDRSLAYYRDVLGLTPRLHTSHDGVGFALLSCNTGHHVLGLYEPAVRDLLNLPEQASTVAVGFQVANFRQLRAAVGYLVEQGYEEVTVPPELVPGFHHVSHVRDPDGTLIQLYAQLRQGVPIGEPAPQSVVGPATEWPATIPATPDAYHGEVFMGPWN